MQNKVLKEIQELKILFAKLIGTAHQTREDRFSEEALNKAANDFLKMSIERNDWIKDSEIDRYIKSAPWNAGAFIRKEFGFVNCFKRGREYLYLKRDLMALSQELAKRNIDLKRHIEFLEDKAAFDKKMSDTNSPKKVSKNGKPFKVPAGLKNIVTTEIPKPSPDLVRQDLTRLKQEFKAAKLEGYIDIYRGTHAMLKTIYFFEKYLEPGLKRRCRKWCDDFNYANHALVLITGKKEKFIPADPDLIQL
jgi:hypothetical protein